MVTVLPLEARVGLTLIEPLSTSSTLTVYRVELLLPPLEDGVSSRHWAVNVVSSITVTVSPA